MANVIFLLFPSLFEWQVITEDYSSTEVPGSDRESFTLHGTNDFYENINVADNRADCER